MRECNISKEDIIHNIQTYAIMSMLLYLVQYIFELRVIQHLGCPMMP